MQPNKNVLSPRIGIPVKTAACAALAMLLSVALAVIATPQLQANGGAPNLEETVPMAFGDWQVVKDTRVQVDVSRGVEIQSEQPYDQTVMRTYVNSQGEQVMLALAWGERQRQDVKVHRPEVCYPAQGYSVVSLQAGKPLLMAGMAEPVPTVSLQAQGRDGMEAVRYWIRIGTHYGGDGLQARWYILKEGLAGRIPDGVLVRASQRIRNGEETVVVNKIMDGFLVDLIGTLPMKSREMLIK
jgi:EpsI family protein